MVDPTKTVTNPRIAKLIQYEDKLDETDRAELQTYRAQGLAPAKGSGVANVTEGERKASAFLSRALGSNTSFEKTGEGPRGLIGQSVKDALPNLANIAASDGRQVSDSAQDEFIAASLRQDSGAAIPEQELERQRRIYFPMPGDGPANLAQKRQARLRALDGLYQSAGRGITDEQRKIIEALRPDIDAAVRGESATTTPLGAGDIGFAGNAPAQPIQQLSPEDRAAFVELAKTASPSEMQKFMADRGFTLENADQVAGARDKGAGINPNIQTNLPKPVDTGDGAVGAAARGLGDTATSGFLDEAGGVVDTLGFTDKRENIWNSRRPLKDILYGNIDQNRAIMAGDEENHPVARGVGQLAGAVAMPIGAGARTPLALAKVGGGLGAAYGLGSGEGGIVDRLPGAVGGGVTGAALGYGLGKVGELAGARIRRGPPDGGAPPSGGSPFPLDDGGVRGAADRLGITPTPATTGGAAASGAQRMLGNLPGSSGPIRNAVDEETEALGRAARDTASRMGTVSTPQQAGEIVARGANVADRTQAREAARAYEARTKLMGGETSPVTMGGAQKAIANIAGDFSSNEVVGDLLKHPLVRRLESADASELTLSESTELLSEARRVLRRARETKQPGRLIRQVREIENAIEGDVMRAAQASDAIAGRAPDQGAASLQKKGDALWSDRMQAQKQELKRALASSADDVSTSGESVYRQLFNDMREEGGNLVRLKRTLNRLPKRARDTFAASAFDDFGKAVPSQQNAATDAWSFQTFMTNWSKASDDAKRVAFGGRGVDREISDIVQYADRLRKIDKTRNFSNTSPNVLAGGTAISALTALMTGNVKTAAAIGGTYAGLNGIGRAFVAVPALRGWTRSALKAAVRGNEAQMQTLTRRLTGIAAANPAVQGEVKAFQQYLLSAANDNISRAAASGGEQKDQSEGK